MAVGAAERVGLLLARGQQVLLAGDLDAAVADFSEAAGLARQLLLATMATRLDADGDNPLARDVADWGTKMFLLIDPDHDVPEDIAALGEATAVFGQPSSPSPSRANCRVRRHRRLLYDHQRPQ